MTPIGLRCLAPTKGAAANTQPEAERDGMCGCERDGATHCRNMAFFFLSPARSLVAPQVARA